MKRFLFITLCCALSLSVAAQGTRPVRGVVFDSDGTPMPNVTLTAVGSTDSKQSGADGTFEMMVSPYTKLIEASKEGFISARAEVDGSYLVFKLQVDKKYAENKAKAEEEARLAAEKAAEAEQARIAAEKAAAEKAERERLAAEEKKRLEEEKRIAVEEAAAEKAERERIAAEEKKRIEEEKRIAAEKAAAEKAERERLAAEEKKRIEEEKKRLAEEKARLAEEKRLALEKAKAEVKAIKSGEDDATRLAQLEQEHQKALAQQALLQEKAQKAEAKKARIEEWKQASLKGYRSMVEFAFMMDFDLMPSYNLHYIGGYQINNYLYVGAGAGVCLHESAFGDNAIAEWSQEPQDGTLPLQTVNVPVFAYFRANFINRRCTPYFAVAAGYRFSTKHYFQMPWQQHDYYNTSGLLINPQLGVNLRMTKKADVYLAAGFNMQ
ncbi:MAG: carboxypeptidase regulatory-like domain-containing protein [Alistipes sp.]|nr:carboxypeptidase regulatory-like domain-containing protein [Alistipes sp.]